MLNEIITQLENSYTDEDYVIVIEELYEDIYDEITENDIYEMTFEEECSFEIKELIANYLNHENFKEIQQDTIERINKSITDSLEILEKYNTPEYQCLVENGFCNPLNERTPYKAKIDEHWHTDYQQQFIHKAQQLEIEESIANKMISGLESII
jgi:hypothetical protein